MTFEEIIRDLKNRGEKDINFQEDGLIISRHRNTINYWHLKNNELICHDCRTVNSGS